MHRKTDERIFLFFLFSFLGWAMEMVFCAWVDGKWTDRGFLRLPFCTIYGFTVLTVYYLLGTPKKGGILLKKDWMPAKRLWVYYLLAVTIPTAAELATGWYFDRCLSMRLWDYSGHPFNYLGYICLGISLCWGALIMGVMGFFPVLISSLQKIPNGTLRCTVWILTMATAGDYGYCLAHAIYGTILPSS